MQKKIKQLIAIISYHRIDDDMENPNNKDFMILINQYMFLLICIFFIQSLCTALIIGFNNDIIILSAVSSLLACTYFFSKDLVRNPYFISSVFFGLTIIVTYYASHCGLESGVFLYYFSLLYGLYFFFFWPKQKLIIISLAIFILINLYVSAFFNFELFNESYPSPEIRHKLLLLNISCVLLTLALNSYFFFQKKEDYYFILNRNHYKKQLIENLNNEVSRLRSIVNFDTYSEESLNELLAAAEINDVIFLEKFDAFFPDFNTNLNLESPLILSPSDRKICAMLKLGFTTKQIAIYNHTSVKSVDSKIYRLRKKLNLPASIDSKTWFSNL